MIVTYCVHASQQSCFFVFHPLSHHLSLFPCLFCLLSVPALLIISLYKPLYAHCMQVSNSKLNLTAQELTCLVACCVDCIELSTFGVRSGITASMETRSSSMTRLEEQLSLLIEKMDQQSEQLQQLTKQQTERVDNVVHRLYETSKHIDTVAGDLDSVKSMLR